MPCVRPVPRLRQASRAGASRQPPDRGEQNLGPLARCAQRPVATIPAPRVCHRAESNNVNNGVGFGPSHSQPRGHPGPPGLTVPCRLVYGLVETRPSLPPLSAEGLELPRAQPGTRSLAETPDHRGDADKGQASSFFPCLLPLTSLTHPGLGP